MDRATNAFREKRCVMNDQIKGMLKVASDTWLSFVTNVSKMHLKHWSRDFVDYSVTKHYRESGVYVCQSQR